MVPDQSVSFVHCIRQGSAVRRCAAKAKCMNDGPLELVVDFAAMPSSCAYSSITIPPLTFALPSLQNPSPVLFAYWVPPVLADWLSMQPTPCLSEQITRACFSPHKIHRAMCPHAEQSLANMVKLPHDCSCGGRLETTLIKLLTDSECSSVMPRLSRQQVRLLVILSWYQCLQKQLTAPIAGQPTSTLRHTCLHTHMRNDGDVYSIICLCKVALLLLSQQAGKPSACFARSSCPA